ncbi:uncharacterized protein At5g39865-like [Rhodamnia argentea]|uniref:Uncharacterized protein At5g39865-like n=1 Tax=Rhodamnia argentea TaxID=178133 RepID=A0A8B8QYM8_9MYRT|nr:uncharacterized protein At5g39865-like [Rhodamnia argentea]
MADSGSDSELASNQKSSLFNRSLTMQQPKTFVDHHPSLGRASSIRKFYSSIESFKGKVLKLRNFFESPKSQPAPAAADKLHLQAQPQFQSQLLSRLKPTKSLGSSFSNNSSIRLPGTEDRIVLYFTSLHGIRRTYEDCYAVRTIFRGFRVWVDERDVSMDLAYKKELQCVLGEKKVSLPQVFIGGTYVGGADAIRQMYETGELAKILERFPKKAPGFVCECCGDERFVPCTNCDGSRKVFDEDEGVLKRCLECNENGLVRCPECGS